MTFLPTDYSTPVSEGNYFRFKKGVNTFRILSSAIVGYEYWTLDKKPVRSEEPWQEIPANAKVNDNGGFQKHFWAFIVWNYEANKAQIMEITQTTIQTAIEAYTLNKKWGDPTKYDLVINATGDGLEREYTVIAEPHTEAPKADISKINLNAMFTGEDPFAPVSPAKELSGEDVGF